MKLKPFSWDTFNKVPIVAIVRDISLDDVKEILPVFRDSGLATIEITMNTSDFEAILTYAVQNFPDLNIGAGTVLTKQDLAKATDLGAQFIVTPVVVKKVIKSCVEMGVPIFPGAFTPTEIYTAWKLGASMVKIYPATSLGPQYIKDLKAPMKDLKLLPTGGINLDNIKNFWQASADGFGIGGQLFDKTLIQQKNWSGLQEHFQAFVSKLDK